MTSSRSIPKLLQILLQFVLPMLSNILASQNLQSLHLLSFFLRAFPCILQHPRARKDIMDKVII